ncbi:MAG: hypothetical protein ACJAS1_001838 [Oleiphilaceae bacterium]|jgi:hypothetical protein
MPSVLRLFVLHALTLMFSFCAQGAWFEASGQAAIHNGDKQAAKQQATQEAIKQALLFAGASVSSVLEMSNGLLEHDRIEIRSSGEVNDLQLISETYHDGYVAISIRADIFAQQTTCQAAQYQKDIVTAWFPIKHKEQTSVGNMSGFGQTIAEHFKQQFNRHSRYSAISAIEPYYLSPDHRDIKSSVLSLARKTNSQFVLIGEISEFSVEQQSQNSLLFWRSAALVRNFTLQLDLFDGNTGEIIADKISTISAPWEFTLHQQVNNSSPALWQSAFGNSVSALLQDNAQLIDEAISCLPTYARVLQVHGEQITVNIGTHHGVQKGDELTLFQKSQFFDSSGNIHQQFHLHPQKVKVIDTFLATAVVTSISGAPLANIQANDFVARR